MLGSIGNKGEGDRHVWGYMFGVALQSYHNFNTMSNFFSKANIHSFLWGLLGAFVIFLCGLLWYWWNGPEEVKVVYNEQSRKDTTITIIKFEPTELAPGEDSNITPQASRKQKAIIQSIITNPSEAGNIASSYRPKFNMPTIVSGYVQGKINSYATININKTEFIQADFIEVTTYFFKPSILKKITPLFVDIVKRETKNSVYQIWSDQFSHSGSKTKVKLSASFPPDTYDLTIGFYLLDELNTKYPTFYSKQFTITIQ
ncbi:MAG: hypothetical protein IPM98_09210 [Lewinellaceae bacterium]|nr:hypothetical protein [Lewinellaceae bacterium]